jgi:hypothetical protein
VVAEKWKRVADSVWLAAGLLIFVFNARVERAPFVLSTLYFATIVAAECEGQETCLSNM